MEVDLPFEVVKEEHVVAARGSEDLGNLVVVGRRLISSLNAIMLPSNALPQPHKYMPPDREGSASTRRCDALNHSRISAQKNGFAKTSHSGTALWKITKSAQRSVDA